MGRPVRARTPITTPPSAEQQELLLAAAFTGLGGVRAEGKYKDTSYRFTKPKARAGSLETARLLRAEWECGGRVFPPRPRTCGSHHRRDEQNVSGAVKRCDVLGTTYTSDLERREGLRSSTTNRLVPPGLAAPLL